MMKLSPSEVLADNLLRLRRARRITTRELAQASGVATGALSRIESGEGNPTLDTLAAIAEALNVPVDDLTRSRFPEVNVVRANEAKRHHRYGLTTHIAGHIAGHIAASGVDLQLAFMRAGKPDWSLGGEGTVDHVLVVAGEIEVDFKDELVSLRPGDYVRFDADVAHRYRAVRSMARAVLIRERRATGA